MVKHHCCAFGCTNSVEKQKQKDKYPELARIRFHPFPVDDPDKKYSPAMTERERRKQWIVACRLSSLNVTRHTRICSEHFEGGLGPTKANPIPSIFDFPLHLLPKQPQPRTNPEERRRRCESAPPCNNGMASNRRARNTTIESEQPDTVRINSVEFETVSSECEPLDTMMDDSATNTSSFEDKSVQSDLTWKSLEEMESAADNLMNKADLKREMFMDDIVRSDKSVKFYTGLPSLSCLMMLFNFLKPVAESMKYWDNRKKSNTEKYQKEEQVHKPGPKRQMSLFHEFVLVLVRLRLGLLQNHLSDIFSISQSSVSKICTTWINLLYHVFKEILVIWPSKHQIRKHLPKSFSKFPRTRVIIDCTEIKVQKATQPSAQKVTWSEYKSHNTFKLLVGISPTGAFTFISSLWSGGVSDRKITQKSGLIDKLEPLDDVMADRGFNIRDLVTKKKATLNIPPFAKGKPLTSKACTKTRRIAAVRIHVERAIERLKRFRILHGVLPLTLAAVADQIVFVCAALCNLLSPLVTK